MRAAKGLLQAASGLDAVLWPGGMAANGTGWAIEVPGWCGEMPLWTQTTGFPY